LRYVLDGRPVELSADLAVPVGMALHELTANAARFVALSVPGGPIDLRWNAGEVEGVRKGQRLRMKTPFGHWKSHTFVKVLS
jgi:two-component sensor histidine kinase